MKIQSLSVVVPNKKCVNDCQFCVSKMHIGDYKNQLQNSAFYDLYEIDYIKRLEFARDNGCNTVMLTGDSEPQQNREFLTAFGTMNKNLDKPFRWIEMQTTGVMLDEQYLRFLRNHVGVSTISLSISSFDDHTNKLILQASDKVYNNIGDICKMIKKYDFNLRLSINLTKEFHHYSPTQLFDVAKGLEADQVTFRILYSFGDETPQSRWVMKNAASGEYVSNIKKYVKEQGRPLERLETGLMKYDVNGIGTVLDDDCMSESNRGAIKYLILREDCKIYTKWDSKASRIF